MRPLLLVAVSLMLAACVTGAYRPPQVPGEQPAYAITVEQPQRQVRQRLLTALPEAGFVLRSDGDHELVFGFGEWSPARLIDCGRLRVRQPSGSPTFTGDYVRYALEAQDGKLRGRIVVTLDELGDRRTGVRVRADYRFTAGRPSGRVSEWRFETGSSDTALVTDAVRGTPHTRTCVPTHDAERKVLERARVPAS